LKKALIPELVQGDVVIIDNAPFHPAERITELLQSAGCNLLFLPRYSPRDDKIEHRWSTRKIIATYADLAAVILYP
jgi:putative transposase